LIVLVNLYRSEFVIVQVFNATSRDRCPSELLARFEAAGTGHQFITVAENNRVEQPARFDALLQGGQGTECLAPSLPDADVRDGDLFDLGTGSYRHGIHLLSGPIVARCGP
jgi:hypothetical protein